MTVLPDLSQFDPVKAGREIDDTYNKMMTAKGKAAQYVVTATKHRNTLIEQLLAAKGKVKDFRAFLKDHTAIGKSTAYRILGIVDGRGEDIKRQERESKRRQRAVSGTSNVPDTSEPVRAANGQAITVSDLSPQAQAQLAAALVETPEPVGPMEALWLADHPGKTKQDYETVSACNATPADAAEFHAWVDTRFKPIPPPTKAERDAEPPIEIDIGTEIEPTEIENPKARRELLVLMDRLSRALDHYHGLDEELASAMGALRYRLDKKVGDAINAAFKPKAAATRAANTTRH